jgi:hypothetical protein
MMVAAVFPHSRELPASILLPDIKCAVVHNLDNQIWIFFSDHSLDLAAELLHTGAVYTVTTVNC